MRLFHCHCVLVLSPFCDQCAQAGVCAEPIGTLTVPLKVETRQMMALNGHVTIVDRLTPTGAYPFLDGGSELCPRPRVSALCCCSTTTRLSSSRFDCSLRCGPACQISPFLSYGNPILPPGPAEDTIVPRFKPITRCRWGLYVDASSYRSLRNAPPCNRAAQRASMTAARRLGWAPLPGE